jgi:diacylglycerol kinase (ATP)
MKEAIRRHTVSFKNALSGIWWALRTQPNFRVHLTLSFFALFLGFILQIPFVEMTILVFAIVLGLTSEMINTSIESMTDLITADYEKDAKIAKDVSAGMMLTAAVGAVAVAILIFLPRLWFLFSS